MSKIKCTKRIRTNICMKNIEKKSNHDHLFYIYKIIRQQKYIQKMYYYQKSIINENLNLRKNFEK